MAIVAKKLQENKINSIAELKAEFSTSKDFIFAEYRGLTVEQISELRKQLRTKGVAFRVVKNNFARIAFEELSAPSGVVDYLKGPTAIAVATNDSNEVAKILVEFSKEVTALKLKGALIGEDLYNEAQVTAFSKLPSKLELISMLMSVMNAPARNLAAALNDIPSRLVRTVKAVADQKGGA